MEYIPIIIGLFFVLSWTYGVFVVGGAYATGTNMFTVIWWWISFVVIFLAFILDDAISAFPLFIWRRQRYSSNSVTFDLQILNCCIRDNCE